MFRWKNAPIVNGPDFTFVLASQPMAFLRILAAVSNEWF